VQKGLKSLEATVQREEENEEKGRSSRTYKEMAHQPRPRCDSGEIGACAKTDGKVRIRGGGKEAIEKVESSQRRRGKFDRLVRWSPLGKEVESAGAHPCSSNETSAMSASKKILGKKIAPPQEGMHEYQALPF